MTTPTPTFDFPADFQSKAAALALREDAFARMSIGFLKPEYFTDVVERNLVQIAQEFVKAYGALPRPETLMDYIKRDKRINSSEWRTYAEKLVALNVLDLKEREYVKKRIVDFARVQAIKLAFSKGFDHLAKGEIDKIKEEMNRAFSLGEVHDVQMIDYFSRVEERRKRREAIATGALVPGVSTGVPELDRALYHKGWGRGELSVIMGPAKRGKTALMLQTTALSCALHGSNGMIVSLEVSDEIVGDRLDAMYTGVELGDLLDKRDDVARTIASMAGRTGKLFIERRPANTLTAAGVEGMIDAYFNAGHKLDIVVVDYLGLMRMRDPSAPRHQSLPEAARELRRIAGKYDLAMITAAQTNRDGVGKQLATMDTIGEAYGVVQDCDLLISINADENEMASGVRRLYFAASRNQAEVTLKVHGNLASMQMIQRVLNVIH